MRPVIACLLGLGALLSGGCDREKAADGQGDAPANAAASAPRYPTGRLDRSHAGTPAPSFTVQDENGQPTSMAAFRGKPTLVNLWATWCAPCIVEMPSLDRLAAQEGGRIQVLALSQDFRGRDKVDEFFAARDFRELQPYLDGEMAVMTALRIGTLPTTILYDAQGREVWRMTGMAEWDGERARRLLAEASPR